MSKQESTAINDLIHLVQGRIIDDSDGDAQDNLFVTARPPAMPAPLPRRRAPNATPPITPAGDYDDDTATSVDPHTRFAGGSAPNPRPSAPLVLPHPQPILPRYALPKPAPLPPAPYHADSDATERVEQYDDLPPPEWHVRPALPARPFEDHLDTVRVAALPPPPDGVESPPSELVVLLKKCALPFAGLAVAMMFVGGALVHRGQGGHERDAAMAAAAVATPIVTPIDEAPAATWKPSAVQPTIAPKTEDIAAPARPPVEAVAIAAIEAAPVASPAAKTDELVAAAAIADDGAEIEMEPTPVVKPRKHRAKKAARVVARAARAEPKPVASPRGRKADPIAVALAEPTKPAKPTKGTGPGKVTITSTPSALIYVDGRSTNQMTPKTLTLAPGVHKITLLETSTRKAKTAEVDVAAGGTAQIAKKF